MKKENIGSMRIIPLGGLEKIGMNITAFEYEDSIIVVDCGLAFPEDAASHRYVTDCFQITVFFQSAKAESGSDECTQPYKTEYSPTPITRFA